MGKFHKDKNKRKIEGGVLCRHCNVRTQRWEHSSSWNPSPGKGYYLYWDRCESCNRQYMFDEAFSGQKVIRERIRSQKRMEQSVDDSEKILAVKANDEIGELIKFWFE